MYLYDLVTTTLLFQFGDIRLQMWHQRFYLRVLLLLKVKFSVLKRHLLSANATHPTSVAIVVLVILSVPLQWMRLFPRTLLRQFLKGRFRPWNTPIRFGGMDLSSIGGNRGFPAIHDITISSPCCTKVEGKTVTFRSGWGSPRKWRVTTQQVNENLSGFHSARRLVCWNIL